MSSEQWGSRRLSRRASSSSTAIASASRIRCSPRVRTRSATRSAPPCGDPRAARRATRGSRGASVAAGGVGRRAGRGGRRRSRGRGAARTRSWRTAAGGPAARPCRELTPSARLRRRRSAARSTLPTCTSSPGTHRGRRHSCATSDRASSGRGRSGPVRSCVLARSPHRTRRRTKRPSSSCRRSREAGDKSRAARRRARRRRDCSVYGAANGSTSACGTPTTAPSSLSSSATRALTAEALARSSIVQTLLGDADAAAVAEERALAAADAQATVACSTSPLIAAADHWWLDRRVQDARTGRCIDLLERARELGDESSRPTCCSCLGAGRVRARRSLESAACARAKGQELGRAVRPAHASRRTTSRSKARCRAQLGHAEAGARDGASGRSRWSTAGAAWHVELLASCGTRPPRACARGVRSVSVESPGSDRRRSCAARRSSSRARCASSSTTSRRSSSSAGGRRPSELLDWYEGNARRLERRVGARQLRALPRAARRSGAASSTRRSTRSRKRSSGTRRWTSARPRAHTARARRDAAPREAASRGAGDPRGGARRSSSGIGAALWAERARAELKRISGRAATPGALTPAEERVAALVAEGKTNREVAAALFLSDRTVEGHLARIFGKLGIRGRTEIASALASGQTQVVASSNTRDSPVSAEPSAP